MERIILTLVRKTLRQALQENPIVYLELMEPHTGIIIIVARRSLYHDRRRFHIGIFDANGTMTDQDSARWLDGVKMKIRQRCLPVPDLWQVYKPETTTNVVVQAAAHQENDGQIS
jgi:hypothetical protein